MPIFGNFSLRDLIKGLSGKEQTPPKMPPKVEPSETMPPFDFSRRDMEWSEKSEILDKKLNLLDIKAIHITNNSDSKDFDLMDMTLELPRNCMKIMANPSYGISILFTRAKKHEELSLGEFLEPTVCGQMCNAGDEKYTPGRSLRFGCKKESFISELGSNEEITFLSSIKESDAGCLSDHYYDISNGTSDSVLYPAQNMFAKQNSNYKGIVVQNLTLFNGESELMSLDSSASEKAFGEGVDEDSFEEFAFELYERYGHRIEYVGKINGALIVRGTDNEKTIYTTLPENELSNGLRSLPNVRTADVHNGANNPVINEKKEHDTYTGYPEDH